MVTNLSLLLAKTIAILFDYDDTLVKTRQCRIAAIQAVARRWYSIDLPTQTIERFWGMEYTTFLREVFRGIEDDVRSGFERSLREAPSSGH
jgi:beta-phosphoglucomutase-like phosphatase (HAD superfamily)